MKVLHVNYSNSDGAGNAARRLCDALNRIGIESEFVFFKPYARSTAKIGWLERKLNGIFNFLFPYILNLRGLGVIPSSLLRTINKSDADIVHLHWINPGMLSVEQIGRIKKPLVWTFHDMWPICGRESYVDDDCYTKGAAGFSGVSRWVWQRKERMLARMPQKCKVLTPSAWMSQCAKNSTLFQDYDVTTLFNCLDLNVFRPIYDKQALREKYGLPLDKKIVLFGAFNVDIPRKGGDLLFEALSCLESCDDVILAVFGRDGSESVAGFKTVWLGRVEGDVAMAEVCNCADVALVPSRQETFGQTASEPQACGVPVVAFDTTGLKDVVDHKRTGYLARPFDVADFARGIEWVLSANRDELSKNAREHAERLFDEKKIASTCKKIYEDIMSAVEIDK